MNVDVLRNELDCLLEIRGELCDADNARIEKRITEVLAFVLEAEGMA